VVAGLTGITEFLVFFLQSQAPAGWILHKHRSLGLFL